VTRRAAGRLSPIIFVAMLLVASMASFLIAFSPFILVSHDPDAVSMSASLNSTEVGQNQTLKVTIADRNTLRIPDELPLSADWRVQNLSLGACLFPAQYPFGIAVFQGRYAVGNVSSAGSPLAPAADFLPNAVHSCPPSGSTVKFGPLQSITFAEEVSGYYTSGFTPVPGQSGSTFGVHHLFAPGEYTLAVGDEWGHVQMLYFQVTNPNRSGNSSNGGGGITVGSSVVDGLQLRIEMNGTAIQSVGALEAHVELFNTLSQNLSLAVDRSSGPNFTEWDNSDFLCGDNPLFGQAGFAVYEGHYTSTNFSLAGNPLLLTPPLAFFCPNLNGGPTVKGEEFGPESHSAVVSFNSSFVSRLGQPPANTSSVRMMLNVTTEFGHSSPQVDNGTETVGNVTTTYTTTEFDTGCCFGVALSGYWTVPSGGAILPNGSDFLGNFNSSYFHHFLPGQYTIAAEDLWNQTVYAHFQVASSANATTTDSPAVYQVLQQSLTISGAAACVPVEFSGLSCEVGSPSLSDVDLISYQGVQVYGSNFTFYNSGQPVVRTIGSSGGDVACVAQRCLEELSVASSHPERVWSCDGFP
jgi:hypothetical protein